MSMDNIGDIGGMKYAIAQLEKKIDFLFRHLNIEYIEPEEPFIVEAKALLRQRRETDAVMLIRKNTNMSLGDTRCLSRTLNRSCKPQVVIPHTSEGRAGPRLRAGRGIFWFLKVVVSSLSFFNTFIILS